MAQRLVVATLWILLMTASATQAGQSTTIQANPAHDGVVDGENLKPPLHQRWERTFGEWAHLSIVVADGRVAVVMPIGSADYLEVLSAQDGRMLWSAQARDSMATIAYESGRLFMLESGGLLRAFDAATGSVLWTHDFNSYSWTSPITAAGGLLYVNSPGMPGDLRAFDAASGEGRFRAEEYYASDHSGPAVVGNTAYSSFLGPNVYTFDRTSGAPGWTHAGGEYGGGSSTPAIADGRLYHYTWADGGVAFDASTGGTLFTYAATGVPAVYGGTMIVPNGVHLDGLDAASGALHWRIDMTTFFGADRYGWSTSQPLVVGGLAYVGDDQGRLIAVRPSDGTVVYQLDAGHGKIPALGAGEGLLIVPAGDHLIAYDQGSGAAAPVVPTSSPVGRTRPSLAIRAPRTIRRRTLCRRGLRVVVRGAGSGRVRVRLRARARILAVVRTARRTVRLRACRAAAGRANLSADQGRAHASVPVRIR